MTDRQPDVALDRLIDVHRGWCNYCKGNVKACDEAPPSGCSLRDYLVALLSSPTAPSRDAVLERAAMRQVERLLGAVEDLGHDGTPPSWSNSKCKHCATARCAQAFLARHAAALKKGKP